MNFVGHAFVALRDGDDPAFVLGAMLPDFLGIVRARGATTDHAELARGIAFHHRTDAVFHAAPAFVTLTARALEELETLGVPHGPARAASHVGIELLLDGFVVDEPGVRTAYERSLARAPLHDLGGHLAFRKPEHAERYDALVARLSSWGLPPGFAEPPSVGDRLVRALSGRPRLALDEPAERTVRAWLPRAKESLALAVRPLLDQMAARLPSG
jgi:hypothetical protein